MRKLVCVALMALFALAACSPSAPPPTQSAGCAAVDAAYNEAAEEFAAFGESLMSEAEQAYFQKIITEIVQASSSGVPPQGAVKDVYEAVEALGEAFAAFTVIARQAISVREKMGTDCADTMVYWQMVTHLDRLKDAALREQLAAATVNLRQAVDAYSPVSCVTADAALQRAQKNLRAFFSDAFLPSQREALRRALNQIGAAGASPDTMDAPSRAVYDAYVALFTLEERLAALLHKGTAARRAVGNTCADTALRAQFQAVLDDIDGQAVRDEVTAIVADALQAVEAYNAR